MISLVHMLYTLPAISYCLAMGNVNGAANVRKQMKQGLKVRYVISDLYGLGYRDLGWGTWSSMNTYPQHLKFIQRTVHSVTRQIRIS